MITTMSVASIRDAAILELAELEARLPGALKAAAQSIIDDRPTYEDVAKLRNRIQIAKDSVAGLSVLAAEEEAASLKTQVDELNIKISAHDEKLRHQDAAIAASSTGCGDPGRREALTELQRAYHSIASARSALESQRDGLYERLRDLMTSNPQLAIA